MINRREETISMFRWNFITFTENIYFVSLSMWLCVCSFVCRVCVWVVTKSVWGRISVSPKVNIARTLKWLPFITICFFFPTFISFALSRSHPPHSLLSYMLFSMTFYVTINFIGHRNECSFHSIYFLNGDSTHFIRIARPPPEFYSVIFPI